MVDKEKIKEGVKLILEAIGEDPNREGLIETPDRIARMYEEIFSGFYSMCEHHLVPFYGKAHIAYIPKGRVAGLSKLARTVETYAKKPQLQEKLTSEVADALMKYLNAEGVMVVIEAEHMCMTMRGVKKPGTRTLTTTYRGCFEENYNLRREVLDLIQR